MKFIQILELIQQKNNIHKNHKRINSTHRVASKTSL